MQYQNKPLLGVKIVDLTTYGAGPSAGKILGDWGADVIKVESPAGDPSRYTDVNLGFPVKNGTSIAWEQLNGNKRAISLDIRTQTGCNIMYRLLESADVLLSSNRLKALEKNGLDWETISAKFPRLIWAHLSGFGQEGPMAHLPGFDTLCFWANSGALIDFAEKDTAPLTTPIAVADLAAGVMMAGGIAAALYQRISTGKGERITFSLYGEAAWMMGSLLTGIQSGKTVLPKSRQDNPPMTNTYRCRDGEWVILSAFEWDRYFPILCKVIGRPELADDPRFPTLDSGLEHKDYLIGLFEEYFASVDSSEVMKKLAEADFPHAKVKHIKDILDDEQALANNYIYKVPTRYHGDWYLPAGPIQFGGPYQPEHKLGPLLGENTDEIMSEIGYSAEEIAKFRADKVIL